MKIAFYLLLLGNVVFYLWETSGSRPKPDTEQVELKLPDNVEPIRLLKELPYIPKKAPAVVVAVPADEPADQEEEAVQTPPPGVSIVTPKPAQTVKASSCYRYGPFTDQGSAQSELEKLQPQFPEMTVISRNDGPPDGYWVLYPKADNIDAARANRKMLMDKGIRDLWLFENGDLAGAISLGVFKTRDRAEALQQELHAKELEVEVRPRPTKTESFWLEMKFAAGLTALQQQFPTDGSLTVKPCN